MVIYQGYSKSLTTWAALDLLYRFSNIRPLQTRSILQKSKANFDPNPFEGDSISSETENHLRHLHFLHQGFHLTSGIWIYDLWNIEL